MADVKISDLGAIAVVAGEDLIAIVDDPSVTPASRKATITQVAAFLDGLSQTLTNKSIDSDNNTITNIVNADIKSAAAIAYSKLAALTDGNILVGNGSNVAVSVNPSGDIDVSNAGVFSIASGVILNADVNASAAIAYSKLNLSNSIVTGDIVASTIALSDIANAAKTEALIVAASDNTTALATGTVFTFYMPYAMTLTDIKASVLTAPTGAGLIVDVHDAGTTIMTTDKLDIDVTEFHTKDAGTQPALTDTALANNAKIEIIVDQVGSTVAGAGLVVYLIGYQT